MFVTRRHFDRACRELKDTLMTIADTINASLDQLTTDAGAIKQELADLQAQVAAGANAGGISATDAQAIADRLAAQVTAIDALVPPPAVPPTS
jgi:hypothetical protein